VSNLRELLRTLFYIYCIYAIYCSLVVFNRPNNPGEIFRSLRIPVVVFVYFLFPCVALYYSYNAYWDIHSGAFWTCVGLVGPLGYFIMLYFLTDPSWPVGTFLHLEKLSTPIVIVLLSLNLAFSVVVAGTSATVFYTRPSAIQQSGKEPQFETASKGLASLQNQEQVHQEQLQGIKREATTTLVEKYGPLFTVLIPLITALVTFATSMITLKRK
jgi:hypothetical protein